MLILPTAVYSEFGHLKQTTSGFVVDEVVYYSLGVVLQEPVTQCCLDKKRELAQNHR